MIRFVGRYFAYYFGVLQGNEKFFSNFMTFTTGGSQIGKSAKKSEKEVDTSYGNMGFPAFKGGIKLNYNMKVFFSSSIYLPETFYYEKSWKLKKLRPPSIQLLKLI